MYQGDQLKQGEDPRLHQELKFGKKPDLIFRSLVAHFIPTYLQL